MRRFLLRDDRFIFVDDLGAGSRVSGSSFRRVCDIARLSLSSDRYCRLLKSLVEFTGSKFVLEFGTSLGISALYLKSACTAPVVYTVEGASEVAGIAGDVFCRLGADINLVVDNFDDFFGFARRYNLRFDFFFIDGNHTKEATLRYFELAKQFMLPCATFVFDDIRWSRQMYEAWVDISNSVQEGVVVEFFKMGFILGFKG